MIVEYESIADASFYCYFVKSGTPVLEKKDIFYLIKAAPHFHRNIEFLFITRGSQKVTVDGENLTVNEGEILFVNSYQPHSYADCDADAYILVLSTTYFEPFRWFFKNKVFPQVMSDIEKNKDIFNFIENWYQSYNKNDNRYEIFMKSNELFHLFTEKYEIQEAVLSRQNELVIEALKYINDHYCDPELTLKICSDAIGYSKEYVSKQFNSIMGISFKSYVNNLRIKKYNELKRSTKGTKQDIAESCGFKSAATFYRALNAQEDESLSDI